MRNFLAQSSINQVGTIGNWALVLASSDSYIKKEVHYTMVEFFSILQSLKVHLLIHNLPVTFA